MSEGGGGATSAAGTSSGEGGAHHEPFSVNAIISLTNVMFFVVVQTLFFWFIASREVDRVVERKAAILRMLREQMKENHMDAAVTSLDATVCGMGRRIRGKADEMAANRRWANLKLVLKWIVPVGAAVLAILIFLPQLL